jgi:hypothetical protein
MVEISFSILARSSGEMATEWSAVAGGLAAQAFAPKDVDDRAKLAIRTNRPSLQFMIRLTFRPRSRAIRLPIPQQND